MNLSRTLTGKGYEVYSFDIAEPVLKYPGVTYLSGNFFDSELLEDTLRNMDVAVHAISTINPSNSNEKYMQGYEMDFLQSVRLLSDGMRSFNDNCLAGLKANRDVMKHNLHNSLMLVTALNPYIGYENAAKTAKLAFAENISLREACVRLGFLTAEKFDEVFHPEEMV